MRENPTIVFTSPGQVKIENRPIAPLLDEELLIKTRCSLISTGTELTILAGDYPNNSRWAEYGTYPFVAGYNNIGEVVAVGANVDRVWLGKRVATLKPHARYVKVSIQSKGPSYPREVWTELSDEEAAFFTIAEIVMNGVRRAGLRWGDAVVVYGLGLLGQFASQFCWLNGGRPVFAVDIAEKRLERLSVKKGLIPINSAKEDVVAVVKAATRGRMADVVFEVTGNSQLIPSEFLPLRNQGRFVVLSSPHGKTSFDFHDLCNNPSFTIIGAHASSHPLHATHENPWTHLRNCELFFDLLRDQELSIRKLISHRESFMKAPELYRMLLRDRSEAMGVLIDWS